MHPNHSPFSILNSPLILLVEDNPDLNEINRRALLAEGFAVQCAASLAQARALLPGASPALLVLDIMLPDGNALEFGRDVRESLGVPVLFLTALDSKDDILAGLSAGDDYMTKPYDLDLFIARVNALMRRSTGAGGRTLQKGGLVLDVLSQQAFMAGQDLLLTQKEFALVTLLLQNLDRPLSKETLYESVWKSPLAGDSGTLWKHMSNLKRKLEGASGGRLSLATSRGEGYRLEWEDA